MTSEATQPDRILGTLKTADGKGVVHMEDTFDTDIDDLWSAFTDPSRLARWIGEFDGDLRLGGEFKASFFATGWQGTGRVEKCERPSHLMVRTRDSEEPDEHEIEVWLTPAGDKTLLVAEERGMPIGYLAAYGAGIQVHVEDLENYLAGRPRVDAKTRWDELLVPYTELAPKVG